MGEVPSEDLPWPVLASKRSQIYIFIDWKLSHVHHFKTHLNGFWLQLSIALKSYQFISFYEVRISKLKNSTTRDQSEWPPRLLARSVWPGLSELFTMSFKFWFRTFIFNADLASDCDKDQIKELLCLDYGILWIVKRFVSSSIIETNSRFFQDQIWIQKQIWKESNG